MAQTEAIVSAAQEEVDYALSQLPPEVKVKPPTITSGIVWAVVRAYLAMIAKQHSSEESAHPARAV